MFSVGAVHERVTAVTGAVGAWLGLVSLEEDEDVELERGVALDDAVFEEAVALEDDVASAEVFEEAVALEDDVASAEVEVVPEDKVSAVLVGLTEVPSQPAIKEPMHTTPKRKTDRPKSTVMLVDLR